MPDAAIIIPQHNRSELTRACVNSLLAFEQADLSILLVDDRSQPAERQALSAISARRPQIHILDSPGAGVTAAWNHAAALAHKEHLIFLNNDALCRGPFVNRLLQPLISGEAVAAGVRLRRETAIPAPLRHQLPTLELLEGWCFAIRTPDWRALGGFDESLSLYFSDTDLQLRLLQHAEPPRDRLLALPHLPVRHLGHQSTRRLQHRLRQWRQDRAVFLRKWAQRELPACGRPTSHLPLPPAAGARP